MHPDLQLIQQAAEGLFYMSESDYPFQVIELGQVSSLENAIKELAGQPSSAPIEKVTLSYFLRNMTRVNPEDSEHQKQTAQRFLQLEQLLHQKLSAVDVYRVGTVQVDVFIVGKTAEGTYAGLKTKSIET